MKKTLLGFGLVGLIMLAGCNKEKHFEPDQDICWCDEEIEFDEQEGDDLEPDATDKSDFGKEDIDKYILSPLVIAEECNCIVEGKIKYVFADREALIVDYGDGECDGWATKYWYGKDKDWDKEDMDKDDMDDKDYDKDKDKGKYKTDDIKHSHGCKFKTDCSKTILTDEEVGEDEVEFVNL